MQQTKKNYTCENPKCSRIFESPKLIQYYACPFCSTKVENEKTESGCLHFFGYLREREKGKEIPSECIECRKSVECMLSTTVSKDTAE